MRLCPSYLSFILYNPIRKALTDRNKIMDETGVTADSVVLEIGAGNGFMTEALAERAKKVYAVELQDGMVRKLARRVGKFGEKVEIIKSDIARYDFPEEFADAAMLYFSFHEIRGQEEASRRIGKAVRRGGILTIYEPSIEVNSAAMRRSIGLLEQSGFKLEARRDGWAIRFARMIRQ